MVDYLITALETFVTVVKWASNWWKSTCAAAFIIKATWYFKMSDWDIPQVLLHLHLLSFHTHTHTHSWTHTHTHTRARTCAHRHTNTHRHSHSSLIWELRSALFFHDKNLTKGFCFNPQLVRNPNGVCAYLMVAITAWCRKRHTTAPMGVSFLASTSACHVCLCGIVIVMTQVTHTPNETAADDPLMDS